jgi:hypothetical protein
LRFVQLIAPFEARVLGFLIFLHPFRLSAVFKIHKFKMLGDQAVNRNFSDSTENHPRPEPRGEPLGASDILSLTTPLGKIYRIAMVTGHLPGKEELRPQPVGIQWPGAWQAFTKTREEKLMQNIFESCVFKTCLSTVGGSSKKFRILKKKIF